MNLLYVYLQEYYANLFCLIENKCGRHIDLCFTDTVAGKGVITMPNNKKPYTIRATRVAGIKRYLARFKDGQGNAHESKVTYRVYLDFQRAIREDRNQDRWQERYIELFALSDEELFKRAINKPKSLEDIALDNLSIEQLERAISKLTETQRRRFLLWQRGLTYRQISQVEGCAEPSVIRSVSRAKEKIYKMLRIQI